MNQFRTDFNNFMREIVENRARGQVGAVGGVGNQRNDLLPEFPINDVQRFEQFNNDLEANNMMRIQLVSYFH